MSAYFVAATLFVDAATFITEMHPALTPHVIASMGFLHPDFAFRTLFKLTALDKLEKLLVIFHSFAFALELGTTLANVKWHQTVETIMFLT